MRAGVKIPIVLVLSIFISFFSVYFFLDFFAKGLIIPLNAEDEFYFQEFPPNEKKIFLIGSSFAGRLNGTLIQKEIEKSEYNNYSFYNLAVTGDIVEKRLHSIDKVIIAQPEIVIYCVSPTNFGFQMQKIKTKLNPAEIAQDINIESNNKQFFDPKQTIENLILSHPIFDSISNMHNPKLATLTLLTKIINYDEIVLYPKYPDKPFYKGPIDATIIKTDEELKELSSQISFHDLSKTIYTEQKIESLKNIITKLQENQIEVIIYVPPFSKHHLAKIPSQHIQEFYFKLDTFGQENSVKVYNYLETYQDMNIWTNLNHFAIHPDSEIVSLEFAKIIVEEIKENAFQHS